MHWVQKLRFSEISRKRHPGVSRVLFAIFILHGILLAFDCIVRINRNTDESD